MGGWAGVAILRGRDRLDVSTDLDEVMLILGISLNGKKPELLNYKFEFSTIALHLQFN